MIKLIKARPVCLTAKAKEAWDSYITALTRTWQERAERDGQGPAQNARHRDPVSLEALNLEEYREQHADAPQDQADPQQAGVHQPPANAPQDHAAEHDNRVRRTKSFSGGGRKS